MSTWPSVISTISNPASTDKLNAPSHSGIETGQNDAISKLETFIGTQASAVGTLMYDIRGANSGGGGHVQAANKGGTGQTGYAKGDILVAQSSSVLTKVAVGTNNQVLTADSNQAAGVAWTAAGTASRPLAARTSQSVLGSNPSETDIIPNASVLGNSLSPGRVIRFEAWALTNGNTGVVTWKLYYGGAAVGTIATTYPSDGGDTVTYTMHLVGTIAYVGAGSQYISAMVQAMGNGVLLAATNVSATVSATSAVDESVVQQVKLTYQAPANATTNTIQMAFIHLI